MDLHKKPIIGVMGSHESEWEELAEPVGALIADMGYHLLTGAGAGVMTSVARGFVAVEDRDGLSIGIIPTVDYEGQFLPRDRYPNPHIELPIVTPLDVKAQNDTTPYSRNYVNIMTSNAVIILPGAHGTRNEASLSIQFKKPMIYFGPKEEFEKFPENRTRVDSIDEVREFLEQVMAKTRTDEEE